MAVGVASPAVGHESAANGGGSREEGAAAPAEEGVLGMRVDGNRVAAPVEEAPAAAGIAVEGEEEEEEDEDDEEEEEEDDEEKWLGQYSSTQSILLVGDGDFSFSLALATGFDSGDNIVATSLDTYEALGNKFFRAKSNITGLESLGATVLHGIDVQTMKLHTDLKNRRFDRIVYNFPHAGFKGKESDPHMINSHKKLVRGFFRNACYLLRPYGEIHVSHKIGKWYDEWGLEDLAAEFSLVLVEKVCFRKADYPGYHQKRGEGLNCDKPFHLGTCSTFKFKIGDLKERKKQNGRRAGAISSFGGDTRPCHPLPLVQPCSGLQFVRPAYTVPVPKTLPSHVFDQRQQPGIPLNFDGIPRATFIYRALHVHCSARQGHQSSLMNASGTAGGIPIPSPMGRISSTSLLASQGYPRYEERTDYFACEYQRSLQRQYWMQRQLVPEGTSLSYSAFLEARQWESVQRQDRLRRMIAYSSQ